MSKSTLVKNSLLDNFDVHFEEDRSLHQAKRYTKDNLRREPKIPNFERIKP